MSRFGLALMLMTALLATSFALPVSPKKSAEESGAVLPNIQKSEVVQESRNVAQEAAEIKEQAQEQKEQLEVKSAPSEAIEKTEIHGLMKEETLPQEHKEDIKKLQEEPKETLSLSEKVMQPLQKTAEPAQPAEAAAAAPAVEPVKELAQPATVQETIIEKKAEAKSSDVAVESEVKQAEENQGAQVKTIVEEKPAEQEPTPEVIEPVAEPKQAAVPAQIAQIKSESTQEQVKIDDKNDRVTREAEEAAKKLAQQKAQQQQQAEEKKEAALLKVPKSQEGIQQTGEKQAVAEEKIIPEVATQEQPKLPVEATIAEHSELQGAATEQQAAKESEVQHAVGTTEGVSQPLLKSHGIEQPQKESAGVEAAFPIEKEIQQGTQQIVDEVKAEVKEAKSAEDPIKAEELPKPEEVKKEIKPEIMSDEVKRPEKLPKQSSEEISEEEKSSEEKVEKAGQSSEEVSSSRSGEISSGKQQPSS